MPPRLVNYVDKKDLQEIQDYLEKNNLGKNHYRKLVGDGVSQCLGIVGKRCLPPNLSRQSWLHPKLHQLLIDFAKKYVDQHINYTSIQVNVDFPCKAHKDINNIGESYIVAFGSYIGGELNVAGFDYNIHQRGLLFDGSKLEHYTKPWTYGSRYSIVYHTLAPKDRFGGIVPQISDFQVFVDTDGITKIKRISDGLVLTKESGLPHPLKKISP